MHSYIQLQPPPGSSWLQLKNRVQRMLLLVLNPLDFEVNDHALRPLIPRKFHVLFELYISACSSLICTGEFISSGGIIGALRNFYQL
jgi:hypothetical protein